MTAPRAAPPGQRPELELDSTKAGELIEELVYEHLIDLVDWPRVRVIEELLAGFMVRALDPPAKPADIARAQQLAGDRIAAAWKRLVEDERCFMERVSSFEDDDDCMICRALAANESRERPPSRT